MKVDKIVLSEGGILLIVCLVFACYYKSVNKLIGSNCTEISCCGFSIKRQPLSEEAALEVMNNQPHQQSIPQVILDKIANDIENSIVNPEEVKE